MPGGLCGGLVGAIAPGELRSGPPLGATWAWAMGGAATRVEVGKAWPGVGATPTECGPASSLRAFPAEVLADAASWRRASAARGLARPTAVADGLGALTEPTPPPMPHTASRAAADA